MEKKQISFFKRIIGFFLFVFSQTLHFSGVCIIFITANFIFQILLLLNKKIAFNFINKVRLIWSSFGFYALTFSRLIKHTDIYNPKDTESTLLIVNHQSQIDIYSILKFQHTFLFLMKSKIVKIPLIGKLSLQCGDIAIDPTNRKSTLVSLKKVIATLKNKKNIVIFPEGTRNKYPETLLPFKEGIDIISKKTEATILPTLIYGTNLIYEIKRCYMWPRAIHIKFLQPITVKNELHPANSSSKLSSSEKIEAIRTRMQEAYQDLQKSVEITS